MRILQLISQTTIGGAEIFGCTLGVELARRGHEVLLLANRENGPLFDRERPANMQVRALNRTSRLDPRILSHLIGSIRRFRPDILHSHNFEANTWARVLGLLFPRLIVICHEHSGRKIRQPLHRIWLDRLLFSRCAAIFVVNEELADLLRCRHRVPERILHIVPNGIDTERYTLPQDWSRDSQRVVCVANLTDVKNHRGLLQAWREVLVEHPKAHLVLVGDGALRHELEEQALAEGTHAKVTFTGLLADVRPELWSASLFVLFSHREALPLSILEAMAARLVCVASEVGGIGDVLIDGVTGRLVPPGDVSALVQALKELLSTPERREAMADRAHLEVLQKYGLSACVDRIEQVCRDLCLPKR